jgi:hypothetical protein
VVKQGEDNWNSPPTYRGLRAQAGELPKYQIIVS